MLAPVRWAIGDKVRDVIGHDRVIEVDATTGLARTVLSEEPKTFFYYNGSNDSRSSGKRFRHDLDDGRQEIWLSERDG